MFVGSEVRLSVDSPGYPSFYKDESITLTCTASGDTDVVAVYLVNGIQVTDDRTACLFDERDNRWAPINFVNTPGFPTIYRDYCEAAAAAAPPLIFSVTGIVSSVLLSANFVCFADFPGPRVNSTSFSISAIRGEFMVLVCTDICFKLAFNMIAEHVTSRLTVYVYTVAS